MRNNAKIIAFKYFYVGWKNFHCGFEDEHFMNYCLLYYFEMIFV